MSAKPNNGACLPTTCATTSNTAFTSSCAASSKPNSTNGIVTTSTHRNTRNTNNIHGAGEANDSVSPLKMTTKPTNKSINNVRGQHKRSSSLPEHILDNVTLPLLLSKDLEKVAANGSPATTAESDSSNVSQSNCGSHARKDSSRSVGGISLNSPPDAERVGTESSGARSGRHYPKLSWDSNNSRGAESGTELENGGVSGSTGDLSNLEIVLEDSKIGRLFSKHFPNLSEVPIKHANYSCSLVKDSIPYHGRLYLTPCHICFYSKLFKSAQLSIPFKEVLLIKKEKSAFVVPNAIKVVSSSQKFLFASLFHRHATFKLMTVLWSRNCCDRALIDYDQISLDSTTGTSAETTTAADDTGVTLDEYSDLADVSNNTNDSFTGVLMLSPRRDNSKNGISPFGGDSSQNKTYWQHQSAHSCEGEAAAGTVSVSDEMISTDDLSPFFNRSCTSPPSSIPGLSREVPEGERNSRTPLATNDEVNALPSESTLTSCRRGSGVVEHLSKPHAAWDQLTATVRYRPLSNSWTEQAATEIAGKTVQLQQNSVPLQESATSISDSGSSQSSSSPQLESRMAPSRRNNNSTEINNQYHTERGGGTTAKGGSGINTTTVISRGTAENLLMDQQGGQSQHPSHSHHVTSSRAASSAPSPSLSSTPDRTNTNAHKITHNGQVPPFREFAASSEASFDNVVSAPPLCHHCQRNIARSEIGGIDNSDNQSCLLLLFIIVLFCLLMTSSYLIWQLSHLSPQEVKELHQIINNVNNKNYHQECHQSSQAPSDSSAEFIADPQSITHKDEKDNDDEMKAAETDGTFSTSHTSSYSASLVQLVLHSCAMKQATYEYLATTIQANNLLLHNINTQLEKMAHSFVVDQASMQKLLSLMQHKREKLQQPQRRKENNSYSNNSIPNHLFNFSNEI